MFVQAILARRELILELLEFKKEMSIATAALKVLA
jgi:hypothetical protein